jgi:uncharacterized membrane protein YhaH (DUF805 family)
LVVLLFVGIGAAVSPRLLLYAGVAGPFMIFFAVWRRLHDIGATGWWALIALIPVIGFVQILALALWPGDPMANRFGNPDRTFDETVVPERITA